VIGWSFELEENLKVSSQRRFPNFKLYCKYLDYKSTQILIAESERNLDCLDLGNGENLGQGQRATGQHLSLINSGLNYEGVENASKWV